MKVTTKIPTITELNDLYFSTQPTIANLYTKEQKVGIDRNGDQFIPSQLLGTQLAAINRLIEAELAKQTGSIIDETQATLIKTGVNEAIVKIVEEQKTNGESFVHSFENTLNGITTPGGAPVALPNNATELQLCNRLNIPYDRTNTDWAAKKASLTLLEKKILEDFDVIATYGVQTSAVKQQFSDIASKLHAIYDANIAGTATGPTPTAVGALTIDEFRTLASKLGNPNYSPYEKLGIPVHYTTAGGQMLDLTKSEDLNLMSAVDQLDLDSQIAQKKQQIADNLNYAKTQSSITGSGFDIFRVQLEPPAAGVDSPLEAILKSNNTSISSHPARVDLANKNQRLNEIVAAMDGSDYTKLFGLSEEQLRKIKPAIFGDKLDRNQKLKADFETKTTDLVAEVQDLIDAGKKCEYRTNEHNVKNLVSSIQLAKQDILKGNYNDITPTASPVNQPNAPETSSDTNNTGKVGKFFRGMFSGIKKISSFALPACASVGTFIGGIALYNTPLVTALSIPTVPAVVGIAAVALIAGWGLRVVLKK